MHVENTYDVSHIHTHANAMQSRILDRDGEQKWSTRSWWREETIGTISLCILLLKSL